MNLPGVFFLTLFTTEREQQCSNFFFNLTQTTTPLEYGWVCAHGPANGDQGMQLLIQSDCPF